MIQSQSIMTKEWYIYINDNREGPYSPEELKADTRITLNTLAWKPGMNSWLPIREIPELRKALSETLLDDNDMLQYPQDELTLEVNPKPPTRWWLVAIVVIFTLIYSVYSGLWLAEWINTYLR